MKKLLAGQIRFVVKKIDKAWRVYDKSRGSYPYSTEELGTVQQDVAEEIAEAEAERLNKKTGNIPVEKKLEQKKQRKAAAAPPAKETVQATEVIEDVAGYGEMSDEDKKKYEEGLFEEVKY